MIYGYVRVSTDQQTIENQKFEIRSKGYNVDKWYEETKSGTIDYKNRVLNKCLKKLKKKDILICSELSRLGRSTYMIMEILNKINHSGAQLITIKENFKLDNTINSKVISFAFGLVAEIERNLISQRVTESLLRLKAEGKHLGRPFGAKNKEYKYDKYLPNILVMLSSGSTLYKISKKYNLNASYLKKYLELKNIKFSLNH